VDDRSGNLAANLARVRSRKRGKLLLPAVAFDCTLRKLVADLVAAAYMATTKNAISRLESGARTRPTLSTIERYASAVGATVEIRVRTRWQAR